MKNRRHKGANWVGTERYKARKLLSRLGRKAESASEEELAIMNSRLELCMSDKAAVPGRYSRLVNVAHYETVPFPQEVWQRLELVPLELLGLSDTVRTALRQVPIFSVAALLLFSEEDIRKQGVSESMMKELKDCLEANSLRLPFVDELQAARRVGFWVELRGAGCTDVQPLRVATESALSKRLSTLLVFDSEQRNFIAWAGLSTIGDMQALSREQLGALWRDYFRATPGVVFVYPEAEEQTNKLREWLADCGFTPK